MLVTTLLLAFQTQLIFQVRAENSTTTDNDDDYDVDDVTSTTTIVNNSTERNCTFSGKVYHDEDCAEWMRNFYIILSISLAGMTLFIVGFIFCGRRFFGRRNGDFERLIESRSDR